MWRLHRLACLAGLFLLVGSAELECPNCHEIHDSRSPGYDGRPPLPADTDMVIEIRTDVFATDGVSGYTTWRLNADIGGEVQNLYALFADANHSISLPAAYQVPTPFGADVGGTNPQLWQFKPETQYDSWLTVSSDDGSAVSALGGLRIKVEDGLGEIQPSFLRGPEERPLDRLVLDIPLVERANYFPLLVPSPGCFFLHRYHRRPGKL